MYRLQVLLRIKERIKRQSEMALAKAIITLNKEKETLKTLEKEKDDIIKSFKNARKDMADHVKVGGKIGYSHVHVNFLDKLKDDEEKKEEEIDDQKLHIEDCEEKVTSARRDYIEAANQFKVMEKHKELWEKKIKNELSAKEAKELDELGQVIHQLKSWRSEGGASDGDV